MTMTIEERTSAAAALNNSDNSPTFAWMVMVAGGGDSMSLLVGLRLLRAMMLVRTTSVVLIIPRVTSMRRSDLSLLRERASCTAAPQAMASLV